MVSDLAGTLKACRASITLTVISSPLICSAETLIETGTSQPLSIQSLICRQVSCSTQSPSATMRPVFSAMAMNSSGRRQPCPSSCHRSSASMPTMRRVPLAYLGW